MVERPHPRRRVMQLSRGALHEADEFVERPETRVGAHREHERIGHHRRDPGEIPHRIVGRSEEHTSELQSLAYLVCRLLLEKKKKKRSTIDKKRKYKREHGY